MTDKQPEALRLADILQHKIPSIECLEVAAAELRRLHDVNAELVEALEEAADEIEHWGGYASEYFRRKHRLEESIAKARAAIAKATGEQQ